MTKTITKVLFLTASLTALAACQPPDLGPKEPEPVPLSIPPTS